LNMRSQFQDLCKLAWDAVSGEAMPSEMIGDDCNKRLRSYASAFLMHQGRSE
jgi:hypothetical protein